jgi:hypothetical protein
MGMCLFTPSSARRSLEGIRPAVETMARLFRAMERLRPEPTSADRPVEGRYFVMVRHLTRTMDRVRRCGARIRNPALGLIDFPARRAGRIVLLCWKVGEPSVDHWHEIEEGYAGRRPVDEEGPWEGDEPR